MRMDEERESSNVEDRRDDSGGGGGFNTGGGGGGGFRLAGGGGIGVIIFAVVAMLFGVDPSIIFGMLGGGTQQAPMVQHAPAQSAPHAPPAGDAQAKFVSRVLASTEDVWGEIFRQQGKQYVIPKLVLFRGQTPTACGKGQTAMGPFYCPGDQKVYIDLAFYQELQDRFKAPGDFAQAYVIAHEVGHHVQNLTGVSD